MSRPVICVSFRYDCLDIFGMMQECARSDQRHDPWIYAQFVLVEEEDDALDYNIRYWCSGEANNETPNAAPGTKKWPVFRWHYGVRNCPEIDCPSYGATLDIATSPDHFYENSQAARAMVGYSIIRTINSMEMQKAQSGNHVCTVPYSGMGRFVAEQRAQEDVVKQMEKVTIK